MKDEKKSIVKEALTDYKDIMEAADANAKKKLADEFPEKFNKLLKEELQNKNKSAKESYKKLDESENNNKSVMKNQSQVGLGKGQPFTNKAKVQSKDFAKKVNEDETVDETTVDETVGDSQPFDKKSKIPAKDVTKDITEERETDYMADLETQTPNIGKGKAEKGVLFTDKIKGPSSGKPMTNTGNPRDLAEEFDVTGLSNNGVNSALDTANESDEVLTMEQIEEEIASMEGLGEELNGVNVGGTPSNGNPYTQELTEMRDKLNEIIGGTDIDEMHQGNFTTANINKMHAGDYDEKLIDEMNPPQDKAFPPTKMKTGKNPNDNIYRGNEPKDINEMNPPQDKAFPPTKMKTGKNPSDNIYRGNEPKGVDEMHQGNFTTANINKMHQGDYDTKLIDEESPITDDDINAVLGGGQDQPVAEAHGVSYGARRTNLVGKQTPKYDSLSNIEKAQSPSIYKNESQKKIGSLIEENKKLTKKVNETKKYKESVTGLVESYKSALGKYRNQLKEMAIFNTSLAHVNNLLVNEELALTQEDKIKIINEFKKVDSIASSQKVYKNMLIEMKGSKKTLTESVENKVSASIQPSSKQKLDEVIEKTAYADNDHMKRMKKIIEYVENRGKKKIIE